MRLVVINHVGGFDHPRGARLLFAGIQVAVEPRIIAAGNFQAQSVSGEKDIAGGPQIQGDVIRLSGVRQLRLFLRIAIPQPQDSFRQVLREPIRPNIHQLSRKVCVDGGTAHIQKETGPVTSASFAKKSKLSFGSSERLQRD